MVRAIRDLQYAFHRCGRERAPPVPNDCRNVGEADRRIFL